MNQPFSEFPVPLPAKAGRIFFELMGPLYPQLAEELLKQVATYQKELQTHLAAAKAANDQDRLTNLEVGDRIAHVATELLHSTNRFSELQQTWIVGAVRYLVERQDSNDDFLDPFGLDDDLAVMNAVATAIGRTDLVVSR